MIPQLPILFLILTSSFLLLLFSLLISASSNFLLSSLPHYHMFFLHYNLTYVECMILLKNILTKNILKLILYYERKNRVFLKIHTHEHIYVLQKMFLPLSIQF